MNLVLSMLLESRSYPIESLSKLRLTLGYLTTVSVAPDAMAASSSSVMSMARLNWVVSVVLKAGPAITPVQDSL